MKENLHISTKIYYGIGSLGKVVQGLAGSTFLLYFYTEILHIGAGLSASIIFFAKLFDIVNDPLIGAIVDRTKSKDGKCRTYLKYFAVPTGICLALCFCAPMKSAVGKIIWVILTYGIQATASSFIQIPMNTLMGRLSEDVQQRSHLNQISGLISLAANYVIVSWTLPVASFFGKENLQTGFLAVGVIYGTIYAVSYMIVYWGTRGCEPVFEADENIDVQKQPGIKVVLGALIQNKIWLCISVYYLFDMIATTLESTAMVFYFQYNLGNTGLLSTYSAVAMVCNGLVFSGIHLLTKRFGNAGTTLLGCILSVSGDMLRFLLHDATMEIMVCGWILSALGSCMVAGTVLLNIFDAKLWGTWKTGIESEALLMSGFTLSTKVGMAVGSAAVGWFLTTVPYTAGAGQQPEVVLDLFFYLNTLLPAGVFFLVFVLALPVYRIGRKLPQIRKELEERRHEIL